MFEAGKSGNPGGRPKGSYGGRIKALAALDRMLSTRGNREVLVEALQKSFRRDPVAFFRTVIMPLLPRESKLELQRGGVVRWRSLWETGEGGKEDGETVGQSDGRAVGQADGEDGDG
ncbi:MAG: hypothetical protein PHR35_16505 [Kiritimatiellae bacterium]|nr:hypothetical protein [Kiritimatiellia bacterium]